MASFWFFGRPRIPPQRPRAAILEGGLGTLATPAPIGNTCNVQRKRRLIDWVWSFTARDRPQKADHGGEMQMMLPSLMDRPNSGEVCLLAESPYRILRAAFPLKRSGAELCRNKPIRVLRGDTRVMPHESHWSLRHVSAPLRWWKRGLILISIPHTYSVDSKVDKRS